MVAAGNVLPGYAAQKRVLFLGNSYTHVNNMPQLVANMALSTGDTLIFSMYAPGGYTIDNHASDTASLNRIAQGGWDYLVLQEQSQLPSFPNYFSNGLFGLCTSFRQHNPCGRIVFYMTWGRENGDADNCPSWPPVCTYLGMDSLLNLRYTEMAVNNHAELSPAGAAWRYVRQYHPAIDLYQVDESHPSAAGSYLVAGCFYAAIFKKNPVAVSYNAGLSATTAHTLKQAAKAVVFDSLGFWDHAPATPVADFNYNMTNGSNEVRFMNQSVHADSYLWDFGDGATSADPLPVHSYTGNGTYTVTLHAYNCDIDTTYESIHQMTVTFCPFTPTVTPGELVLCPATSDTLSTQVYDAYQWYDRNHDPVPGANGRELVVATNDIYYVTATLNGCAERSVPAEVSVAGNPASWAIIPVGELLGEITACEGDTIALVATFNKPPAAPDSLISWSFNGNLVTGYHNDTLLITESGVYEALVRHERCAALDQTRQIGFTFVPCATSITEPKTSPFVIAPNPVHDVLRISSALFLSGTYSIRLENQLGQVLHRQQSRPATLQYMDCSGYPAGIYFISVYGSGGALYRGKVLKQ